MSSSTKRDPYEILGVARDADETVIKKAFRRLARELHPDVNAHDPQAEEKFKEAAEAYEILSDPERRATFDRYGHDGLRGAGAAPNFDGFGSISDLFDAFFGGGGGPFGGGGGRGGPAAGGDVAVQVEIDLAEAFTGVKQQVSFEVVGTCSTCHGNGATPGTPIRACERCGGAGRLQAVRRTPFGQVVQTVECDTCHGDGRVPEQPCTTCRGRGREVTLSELDVDIPAGIADGQRIRVSGRGHAGELGGPAGDLYVLVVVRPHDRFLRDGDDLVTVLDVPAPRAALGTTIELEGLDGPVTFTVPAGTQPGEVLSVRGRGVPVLRRPGRAGDLRGVVNVVIPRRLSKEQKRLLEQLAGTITEDNLRDDETMVGKLRRLMGQ
ncbi:molecular chaperone DnaJ [Conexibacter sp. W3-3-2]|uniref:Chaperone protein DnaJ n=1 Tax=Paraconexibacter algicola TaxID=2133960 RepID=A0A2T4UEP2_9ACTN|nr:MULTISPECIES: molecular chaperone DnaJ [Solirubrobacterales]MTD42814.1 molecular chaperone DnaJ [Conexibacter sp. W3-3-2]PTL56251.1 molecular chaperone DnaJ [Paraconexibacter algicola]